MTRNKYVEGGPMTDIIRIPLSRSYFNTYTRAENCKFESVSSVHMYDKEGEQTLFVVYYSPVQ